MSQGWLPRQEAWWEILYLQCCRQSSPSILSQSRLRSKRYTVFMFRTILPRVNILSADLHGEALDQYIIQVLRDRLDALRFHILHVWLARTRESNSPRSGTVEVSRWNTGQERILIYVPACLRRRIMHTSGLSRSHRWPEYIPCFLCSSRRQVSIIVLCAFA